MLENRASKNHAVSKHQNKRCWDNFQQMFRPFLETMPFSMQTNHPYNHPVKLGKRSKKAFFQSAATWSPAPWSVRWWVGGELSEMDIGRCCWMEVFEFFFGGVGLWGFWGMGDGVLGDGEVPEYWRCEFLETQLFWDRHHLFWDAMRRFEVFFCIRLCCLLLSLDSLLTPSSSHICRVWMVFGGVIETKMVLIEALNY